MAKADMNIKILTISENELRKIIREEVQKIIEPGAYRAPYLPTPPAPWWQNPVICDTGSSIPVAQTDTFTINADQDS